METPSPLQDLTAGPRPVSTVARRTWEALPPRDRRRLRQNALRGRPAADADRAAVVADLAAWHVRFWWLTPVAVLVGVVVVFTIYGILTAAPIDLGTALLAAVAGAAVLTPIRYANARRALGVNRDLAERGTQR